MEGTVEHGCIQIIPSAVQAEQEEKIGTVVNDGIHMIPSAVHAFKGKVIRNCSE
jgi:hypothetical protein